MELTIQGVDMPATPACEEDSIIIHETYPAEISSSRLRLMLKKCEDICSYVPDSVVKIIDQFK